MDYKIFYTIKRKNGSSIQSIVDSKTLNKLLMNAKERRLNVWIDREDDYGFDEDLKIVDLKFHPFKQIDLIIQELYSG